MRRTLIAVGFVAALVVLGLAERRLTQVASAQARGAVQAPVYEVDPFWPKPLPNHWVLGSAIGVWADAQDNVWIIHRGSATLDDNEKALELKNGDCCAGAPPVHTSAALTPQDVRGQVGGGGVGGDLVEALLQVDVHTPCTPTAGSPEGTRRQNVAR